MTRSTSAPLARQTTGGISLRGLTKSFRGPAGPVHAVRGIDIEISAGETVALLGPNGAGKSTTIDMLLGLTQPAYCISRHQIEPAATRRKQNVLLSVIVEIPDLQKVNRFRHLICLCYRQQ